MLQLTAIVHTADIPLGEEAVLLVLGENIPLSVFTGLGIRVSIARKVRSYHSKILSRSIKICCDDLKKPMYLWIGAD